MPLCFSAFGVGARQQHHPVGLMRDGRPHLLAVDDVVVAHFLRARLERGQVRARVGLRVALAPDLLAGQHLRRIAPLLLLGAVGDDGGTGHADRQDVEHGGRLGQRDLLLEDHLLHEGEPAAAVVLRPGQAHEARVVHLALPRAKEVVDLGPGHVRPHAHPVAPVLGQVLREPGPDFVPERCLLRGQRKIHKPSLEVRTARTRSARLNDNSFPSYGPPAKGVKNAYAAGFPSRSAEVYCGRHGRSARDLPAAPAGPISKPSRASGATPTAGASPAPAGARRTRRPAPGSWGG